MNQAPESNFITDDLETTPGSSSDVFAEVMDKNANIMDVVPEIQLKHMKNKAKNVKSKYKKNKTKEMTAASQLEKKILKTKDNPSPSSNIVTEVIDSNENAVDIVPDIQSKYIKNETGNEKSKIQNNIKEMTVVSQTERNNWKRKADHPPASEMVIHSIKALKKQTERNNRKRKADHPPTSEMVMDSIKALKKRNGATFEDIRKYMEEKYAVNTKRLKYHAEKFLQKGVNIGILEKIDRNGAEERFKIKKTESNKKDGKRLPRKEGKLKSAKKIAAAKKHVKK